MEWCIYSLFLSFLLYKIIRTQKLTCYFKQGNNIYQSNQILPEEWFYPLDCRVYKLNTMLIIVLTDIQQKAIVY